MSIENVCVFKWLVAMSEFRKGLLVLVEVCTPLSAILVEMNLNYYNNL